MKTKFMVIAFMAIQLSFLSCEKEDISTSDNNDTNQNDTTSARSNDTNFIPIDTVSNNSGNSGQDSTNNATRDNNNSSNDSIIYSDSAMVLGYKN